MGNLILRPASGGDLKLQDDSGADKLTIHENGRVVQQGVVGFYAYGGSGTTSVTQGSTVPFTSTKFNHDGAGGTCFNTSTYKFIPPVTGYYSFSVQVYLYSGNGNYVFDIYGGTSTTILRIAFVDGMNDTILYASTIWKCTADEEIVMKNISGGTRNVYIVSAGVHTAWSAYFLGA